VRQKCPSAGGSDGRRCNDECVSMTTGVAHQLDVVDKRVELQASTKNSQVHSVKNQLVKSRQIRPVIVPKGVGELQRDGCFNSSLYACDDGRLSGELTPQSCCSPLNHDARTRAAWP